MDRNAKDLARSKRKLTQKHSNKHSRGGRRGGKEKAKDVKSAGEHAVGTPPPQVTAIEVELHEKLSAEQIKYGKRGLGNNQYRFQGLEEEEGSGGADMRALLEQEDVEEESAAGAYFQLLGNQGTATAAVGLNATGLATSLLRLHGRERLLLGPCPLALEEALENTEELKPKGSVGNSNGGDASREARLLEELYGEVTAAGGTADAVAEVTPEGEVSPSGDGEDEDDLENWLDSVL